MPELLSYLQVQVDEDQIPGQFILTGSHQLELRQAITQSLAGRIGLLNLYPFSMAELTEAGIHYEENADYIFNGFLPKIYDKKMRPSTAYSNYFQTYVERDVRQLIHLKDVTLFEKFIKLLAGRVGQLLDYSSLANDVGISVHSVKSWLSILEASFIIVRLQPYFENFGKRMVKSSKYYFVDTGLLSFILGIQNSSQVSRDPLIGALFENLVVMECFKAQFNQGQMPSLYFYRDSNGLEVDLLWQDGRQLVLIEIKSSSTYNSNLLKSLKKASKFIEPASQYLVYSGDNQSMSDGIHLYHFTKVSSIFSDPSQAN